MTQVERLDRIVRSSVPFRRVIAGQLPTGTRSGCIIDYNGTRYFLTTPHLMRPGQHWAIEIRAEFHNHQTQLFDQGPLTRFHDDAGKPVDLAFVAIPNHVRPKYQTFTYAAGVTRETRRVIFSLDPELMPSTRAVYGFSGQNSYGITPAGHWYLDARLEADLKYIGMQGNLQVFQLSHPHPGHPYYFGCSGSPIVDGAGRVVGLVKGGDVAKGIIYGISIQDYADQLHP